MSADALKTSAETGLAGVYEAARAQLPGNSWVQELRQEAWEQFAGAGLPHRRVEEWKYTDLRAQLREAFAPAPLLAEALSIQDVVSELPEPLTGLDCYRLVIVDGQFRAELSDMEAVSGFAEILSLSDALNAPPDWFKQALGQVNPQPEDPVAALNMALMSGGVALHLKPGKKIGKPLHIVHVQAAKEPAGLVTRNVIAVGKGVSATIAESFIARSGAPAQRNALTELTVGEGARVEHVKYQNEGAEAVHLSTWMTRLDAEAVYRAFQFSTGAVLARNQLFVAFAGEGASSHLNGAVMARGKQHNDTTMVVDHAVPACESREFNKLVLDDEARGVVQCKVNVHRDAQKSDGHQMAQAMLLSERAEFDSKPELEIFADDVVCGHGSTSGQVDEDLLFYLRSRGIPADKARALLIAAFAGEAIEKIEHEAIREAFRALAEAWLADEGK